MPAVWGSLVYALVYASTSVCRVCAACNNDNTCQKPDWAEILSCNLQRGISPSLSLSVNMHNLYNWPINLLYLFLGFCLPFLSGFCQLQLQLICQQFVLFIVVTFYMICWCMPACLSLTLSLSSSLGLYRILFHLIEYATERTRC